MIAAIETTGESCGVALLEKEELLVEYRTEIPRSHDRMLATMFSDMLVAAQAAPEDLKAIALSVGPGSFTGIRIGMSFAIGYAAALDIPIISVSTLDAIAWNTRSIGEVGGRNRVLALISDRRGGVYSALYEIQPEFHRLTAPYNIPLDELLLMLDENVFAAGPGARMIDRSYCDCVPEISLSLTAASIGRYGYRLYRKGVATPPEQIQPLYVGDITAIKPTA